MKVNDIQWSHTNWAIWVRTAPLIVFKIIQPLEDIHVEKCFFKFYILHWCEEKIWKPDGIIRHDGIFACANKKQKSTLE